MSETKGPQRLGKAATQLNVSKDTIVEFLAKKGVSIDSNPMAKIEAEVYDMLLAEFAGDQIAKEKTKAVATKIKESRETVTIQDSKKKSDHQEEEISEIDLSQFKRKRPEPKPEEIVESQTEVVVENNTEKEISKDPIIEPVTEKSEGQNEVKIIGKIDLSTIQGKGRKKKEATPEPTPAPVKKGKKTTEEVAVVANETVDQPIIEKSPEAVDEPMAEPLAPPKPEEKELIRVNVERLTGPKVMGHIVLPVEQEKKKPEQKVDDNKEKRKRKRVSKVDINRQQEIDKRNQNRPRPGQPGQAAQPKAEMSEQDIQNKIRETLARLGGQGKSKASKNRRDKRDNVARKHEERKIREQAENAILKLTEFVTVSELATMMNRQPTEIIAACMQLGIFASINQRLDAETIQIIAEEFGFEIQFVSAEVSEASFEESDTEDALVSRPPVVTVMGHVDHGKTSLLDFIRKANVVAGEAGGITQHMGAYSVKLPTGKQITFIDTPGHEAFTAMRARGAQVTDLVIIVIAADDNVMPQTKEAISHALAAGVPMIFAYNKIDKEGANPDKIREQLSAMNILVEEWGGKYQSQEIAAKKGLNIDKLLEKVVLEAEMLDLKANPNKRANGTIIEASLDKGRGFVTTCLVSSGTMRIGDSILAGQWSGRVRAMFNERGQKIDEAGPATPVSILGFEGAPNAGDKFFVFEDEREAREIATKRQQLQREQSVRTKKHLTIEEIGRRIALGDFKELNLIVKGDVDGSVEALVDSLQKLSTDKVQVSIVHKGVGQISESDVLLASASDAIIVGFQVRPSTGARKLAEAEEITRPLKKSKKPWKACCPPRLKRKW
jgi:translation initiation factor IF-2